jgi:hypothetical protein
MLPEYPCTTVQGPIDESSARFLRVVERNVREKGYHLTYVHEHPPFCYSVGLWSGWNHPELIVISLNFDDASTVLGALARQVKAGAMLRHGVIDTDTFERPVAFLMVDRQSYPGRFPVTVLHYGHAEFDVLQVVVPDASDSFPWDQWSTWMGESQPLLGGPPDAWEYGATA